MDKRENVRFVRNGCRLMQSQPYILSADRKEGNSRKREKASETWTFREKGRTIMGLLCRNSSRFDRFGTTAELDL